MIGHLDNRFAPAGNVTYIYALVEPDTEQIRYIGKSIRPKERLLNHLNDKAPCHRTNWLKSLKRRGMVPDLVIIEEWIGEWEPWQDRERFWISYALANGCPLVNETSGGDGVPDLPKETRERITAASRLFKHSPETIELLRRQRVGVSLPETTRDSMRKSQRGRIITWGDKLAEVARKLTACDVADVQRRLLAGERNCDLATEYGVHRTTLSKVKMGTYFDRYRKTSD